MKVKFKKLNESAVIPKFAKPGDAGMDLVATSYFVDEFGNHCYGTGLSTEFESGFVGLIFPRSSVTKYGMIMGNSVGVLDAGYRGEILIKFKEIQTPGSMYKIGDKIAQLVFLELPKIEIEEVENLSESERGVGGFGSTGN